MCKPFIYGIRFRTLKKKKKPHYNYIYDFDKSISMFVFKVITGSVMHMLNSILRLIYKETE
jgi:hypothetical protein